MTARVVLATRNAGKIAELRAILAGAGLDIELVGVDAFPELEDVAETGDTFAANALLKARAVSAATRLPAIADDSGLSVDALNGMPGIFSARWAGRHGDDEANLQLVLAQLSDVPDERRGAEFVCAAVYVDPAGREAVCQEVMRGHIIRKPRGDNGFGYDPIFAFADGPLTTAEMSAADKNAVSHRGKAFRALAALLTEGSEGLL
ncbi:MAG: XTP/dITP diphosphohydrolase [Frankiaceae bacterium]|jgi:XTP/dITP diphosphohydrolase|nr:XTP/dITP diphosphohydrolase [Frankiaceae bacterium]MDQ1715526.1 XTP/dITP diphosphohydrolase [Frankiaceae bacterium]